MKKLCILLLSICSVFTYLTACQKDNTENSNLPCVHEVGTNGICAHCQEYIPTDDVIYRVSEDGTYAEACGYQGDESAWQEGKFIWLVIAKEYNGVPVTKIADNAFQKLGYEYNGFINGVCFPDSITYIGDGAFDQCLNVGTIHLPSNLTYIGDYAFKQTDLTSVKIPNSVTHIGDGAFRECDELTTVEMGTGVTFLGDFVFGGCRSLTSITISSGITTIGEQVFENCDKLEEIIIPDNVTSIGDFTFVDCDSLQYVEIGDGVETIHSGAFDKCKNLTTVLLGEKVQTIYNNAFEYCDKLDTIYYKGSEGEWENEDFNTLDSPNYNEQFSKTTVYFYSEDMPYETGNYWHYDKDGKPVKWNLV